jgi:hypothetical protein
MSTVNYSLYTRNQQIDDNLCNIYVLANDIIYDETMCLTSKTNTTTNMSIYDLINLLHDKHDQSTWQHIWANIQNQSIEMVTIYVCNFFIQNKVEPELMMQFPYLLNYTIVNNSPTHGIGVFANQFIPANTIVTCYPYHFITTKTETKFSVEIESYQITGEEITKARQYYRLEINPNHSVYGIPKIYDNPNYVGHLINDGNNHPLLSTYEEMNKKKVNCRFWNIFDRTGNCRIVTIVTTKDVQVDEEFFISYGHRYWRNYNKIIL